MRAPRCDTDFHTRMHEARMQHFRRHPPPRMQRWLFFSFGVSIVLTMLVSSMLFHAFVGTAPEGPPRHGPPFVPLALAACALWLLSGWLARRLTMPLRALGRVAEELGAGNLDSRMKLPHRGTREVIELAHAFNTMAERIATQVKGQKDLLSAVSHELRTPLARMRVLVEMAREQGNNVDVVARMEREIADMDALVGELLASTRIETGALQKTTLDVDDLLQSLRTDPGLHDVHFAQHNIRQEVHVDPTLITRALRILFDNARKYGGKEITLRVFDDGPHVVFEVTDDGPGFAEADLARALQPFARGHNASQQHAGVGLGLYLVRRIAEAHGGRAFARNNSGSEATRGACVGFSFRK